MTVAQLPGWLTPPTFPDEERTRIASLVYSVLLLTLTMTVSGTLAAALVSTSGWQGLIPGLSLVLLEMTAIVVVRRGYVHTAAWALVCVLWVGIVAISILIGGLNAATVTMLTVVILIAGMITGWRGNLLTTIGSVLVLSLLFALERFGYSLPVVLGENPMNVWVTSVVNVVATGLILNLALQLLNRALETGQQREEQLQIALRELQHTSVSQAYMDSIVNSMLDMLIVLDENLRIVTINQSAAEQLDHYRAELIGKPLAAILGGEDKQAVLANIQTLLEDESSTVHTTTRYLTRGGEYLHVDFAASRLRYNLSERQVVCVAHDITDRVKATNALRRSERRLRISIDNVNAILFTLDAEGNFTSSEGKGLEDINLEPNEVVGENIFRYYESLPELLEDVRRALHGETFSSTRYMEGMVFESYFSPLTDPDGTTTGVIGFAINITDRVQAERALEKEQVLLRTLVDTLPDLIHVQDLEGRYILSNAAHMNYIGVERESDILGKTSDEVYHDTVVTSYMEDTQMVMMSGRPVVHVERRGQNADGKTVWLQVSKVPMYDARDRMMGIMSIATDITQRKQDEERIRASEERLRAVMTSAPVFIFAVDRDYNLTFFEGQGVDELQIKTVGKMLGESLFRPTTEQSGNLEVTESVRRAFQGESVKTTADISPLTFDIRYSPMYDVDGTITGVTGVATDISDRVIMENALRDSEARNRALLAALPDLIFVVDKCGTFIDFNIPEGEGSAIPVDEIIGSNLEDVGHQPAELEAIREAIDACLETGELQTVEYELEHNRYEGRMVRLNIGEVLIVVRDVTKARRAQAEIYRREEMYRTLARHLPGTAVMLFDHDLRYIIAEGPALAAQGYDANVIEGTRMQEILPLHAASLLEPLYRQALAGETRTFEFPPQPSAQTQTYHCTLLPLRNEQDGIYAGMLVVRDVTEDRRKTRDLQQFAEELARSNNELQEFAYVASHDLQEPLRKIQAFGGRLQQRAGDTLGPTEADYLARMLNAAERMQTLIQALLTFSRVTTQAQPFEATDLNRVVQGVLNDLEWRIEQQEARVEVGDLPIIEAEHHQMRQLFQNVIGNALKYSRPDVPPHIRIWGEEDDSESTVQIFVQDNGIGFQNQYAERIFRVFQRLHARTAYEGTGMGLAICRKIVELHGGEIYASGQDGDGATFVIRLPYEQ